MPVNEDKSTRYRRAQRGYRIAEVVASTAVFSALTASPLPLVLRQGITAVVPSQVPLPVLHALVAALVLSTTLVVAGLASLPLARVRLGPLARRYGQPVVDGRSLLRDRGRHTLAVVVAGTTAWCLFARLAGAWPWLASLGTGLAIAVLSAVVMGLAPVILLLSPRIGPIRDEAVTGRLHALASRAGLRVAGLHQWHAGSHDAHANAALVGVIGARRLLVSDTLLEACPSDEIDAVVAHELGHHAHGHTWRRVRAEAVLTGMALGAAHLCAVGPARWVTGTEGASDPASIAWMALGAGLTWMAGRPWLLAQSRQHETEADAFAVALTGRADVLERVLTRLGARTLSSDDDSFLTRAFFLTHPPIPSRVAAARRLGAARLSASV